MFTTEFWVVDVVWAGLVMYGLCVCVCVCVLSDLSPIRVFLVWGPCIFQRSADEHQGSADKLYEDFCQRMCLFVVV